MFLHLSNAATLAHAATWYPQPQPPLELLRLLVDRGGLYDPKTLAWWPATNHGHDAAGGPPGGGRPPAGVRVTRHVEQDAMAPPGEAAGGCVPVATFFVFELHLGFIGSKMICNPCSSTSKLVPAIASAILNRCHQPHAAAPGGRRHGRVPARVLQPAAHPQPLPLCVHHEGCS